jgi:asparagine synthase (glutamine-hydrolysing)
MGDVQTKRLLRESMRGILPETIRTRWNKQGFRPPQENWFQGRLLELSADLLSSRSFRESPYWESAWWDRVMNRILKGEGHLGWSLWQPLMSELWKRDFVLRLKSE